VAARRAAAAALAFASWLCAPRPPVAGVQLPAADIHFTNIARDAGLDMPIVFGGREKNTYLVETTAASTWRLPTSTTSPISTASSATRRGTGSS
jgi:hypothetical protein